MVLETMLFGSTGLVLGGVSSVLSVVSSELVLGSVSDNWLLSG